MSPPLDVLAELVAGRAWVVGGAVRDELLGRPTTDVDVTVEGDPRELAHALARRVHAHRFELSEAFGAWRVVARDHSWQVDLLPLGGESIESDLARRDLTINAIARPVDGGELVDPTGGARDLVAGVLRVTAPDVFEQDPLRALRVVRFACELGFDPEPATSAAAAVAAERLGSVAVERVFAELRRIILSDRVLSGLDLMDELGLMAVVLPEFAALHGVEQSHFHHLDVHGHTCAVLAETMGVVADPERVFGAQGGEVAKVLAEPLGAELDRGQALRFGALLHDIAKPRTRAVGESGRVTFFSHDTEGAAMATEIIRRLRAGERLAAHTSELVRHHLRLGFLVHEMPLSRDAIYGYLSACEPVGVDVTVLSVADRLATRGRNAEQAIARHLELAQAIMPEALDWHRARPTPPVRGDELVRELGVPAGPELGRLLARLERESYAGELTSHAQVLARARELAEGG